ncbi:MAG: arylamine N-acetyltransferase [Campylobacterales bacterium]|nr:arylamine N-acetyltransferase [Campylobacterales bacterium]
MRASNFNLADYLSRIGYEGSVDTTLATLTRLVQKQLRTVPFENTEVQAGRIPSMVPEEIVDKVLTRRRGGYCYEINGIFSMALSAIGFEWYFAAARPMFYPVRRPRTHMIVIVRIEGRDYLCDTAFGGYALRAPMMIEEGDVVQDDDHLRLELIDGEYVLSSLVQERWQHQYGFTMQPQEWIEFTLANYYNATHPDTIFTQKRLAILQTTTGRKILMENELKCIEEGKSEHLEVDYNTALKEHFGLEPW